MLVFGGQAHTVAAQGSCGSHEVDKIVVALQFATACVLSL